MKSFLTAAAILAACALAFVLGGCSAHVVDGWQSTWGVGAPVYPCSGFAACVTFPSALDGGSLNDLQYNYTAALTEGSVLSIQFEVATQGAVGMVASNGEWGTLRATLMLDQRHDDNVDIVARWYCTGPASGTFNLLPANENQAATLSCPLEPYDADGNAIWTDIDGQPDGHGTHPFEDVLADMGSINIVFGGDGGLAHGVAVEGDAVGEVQDPAIQPAAGAN